LHFITPRHTPHLVGLPLDEGSALCSELYLTTHNNQKDIHATGGIRTRHPQQASGRSRTSWTAQPLELALGGSVVQKLHTLVFSGHSVFSCQLSFHKCSSFTVTVSPQQVTNKNALKMFSMKGKTDQTRGKACSSVTLSNNAD